MQGQLQLSILEKGQVLQVKVSYFMGFMGSMLVEIEGGSLVVQILELYFSPGYASNPAVTFALSEANIFFSFCLKITRNWISESSVIAFISVLMYWFITYVISLPSI